MYCYIFKRTIQHKLAYDAETLASVARCLSVCMCAPSHPLASSEPCPLWDVFVQCEASQMNGLWSDEVSSVDLGVTWTQWRPGLYRENKNRDPQAHGPCRGRGLDMVSHFRKKKKKKKERSGAASEGMFWISSTGLNIISATSMLLFLSCPFYLGSLFTV